MRRGTGSKRLSRGLGSRASAERTLAAPYPSSTCPARYPVLTLKTAEREDALLVQSLSVTTTRVQPRPGGRPRLRSNRVTLGLCSLEGAPCSCLLGAPKSTVSAPEGLPQPLQSLLTFLHIHSGPSHRKLAVLQTLEAWPCLWAFAHAVPPTCNVIDIFHPIQLSSA